MVNNNLKLSSNERVYGLDVFRAVAILLVVLSHGTIIAGDIFWFSPSIPLFNGVDGVELFFVLSGFLIGSILIKTVESSDVSNGYRDTIKTIANFWKRRWFRTLPLYYLILFLNFTFVKYGVINGDLEQFGWSFMFFTQNLFEGFYGFFWESWSLSVEEWFYIILPLSIFGFRLFLSKNNSILATILVLILAPMLYRVYQADMKVDDFWYDVEFRKVVLMRLDTIVYGVLAAYIKFYYKEFWKKCRYPFFAIGFLIMYYTVTSPHPSYAFYSRTFYFTLVSVGTMLLLPMADSVKSFRFKWIGKPVTHISKISYSMYLINLALVSSVIMKNYPPSTTNERWAMYLIFWGVTVGVSTILYYFFEKPIMKLRDRF